VRENTGLGIKGVSLDALAQIMLKLGAVDALNLDGGGSSEFVLNGVPLNVPYGGERKIPVALAVK
jgi:exopolysaccharide biosynthesis protein